MNRDRERVGTSRNHQSSASSQPQLVIGALQSNAHIYQLAEDSLRTDPKSQASALEYKLAQHFIDAKRYGVARGELLAEILRHGQSRDDSERRALAALDSRFTESLTNDREILAGQFDLVDELVKVTRIAQDRTLYEELKKRYFELGIELGETQGKSIGAARYERASRRLNSLREIIIERLGNDTSRSAPEYQAQKGVSGTNSSLLSALAATSSRGERVGIDRRIAAEVDAAELYRAIAGWKEYLPTWFPLFKSFHSAHAILSGKSEQQLQYIDESMRERRGIGLRESLIHAFGKRYQRRIDWLVSGDEVGSLAVQAARGMRDFIGTRHSRGEGLRSIYERIPADSLVRFERLLAQELKVPTDSLKGWLSTRITESTALKLDALRRKDIVLERVLHVEDLISSKHSRQIELRRIFRKMRSDDVEVFCARYKGRFGRDLRDDIIAKLRPSPAKDLCLAVLDRAQ